MAKDYYKILGVAKNASADEIKKAFRKLAHQHHPDKGHGNEGKFKELNEAYQALSNPEKRAQYDRFGQTFSGGGPGFGGSSGQGRPGGGFDFGHFSGGNSNFHFDFEDAPLEDLFSEIFGGSTMGGQRRSRAGENIAVDIEMSFEEMARGTEREIHVRKRVVCDVCRGAGGKPGSEEKTCPRCQGAGQIRRSAQGLLGGLFTQVIPCDECHGRGHIPSEKCEECAGAGRIMRSESVTVKIPAGIGDGMTLSLHGKGAAGEIGAPAGDLLVTVHVAKHPHFTRERDNVMLKRTISFAQAALGGTLDVETLEGRVSLKIPAGTQPGTTFRLFGQGIPHLNAWGKGDQLITVDVRVPKKLSREEKQLIEKLKQLESE